MKIGREELLAQLERAEDAGEEDPVGRLASTFVQLLRKYHGQARVVIPALKVLDGPARVFRSDIVLTLALP